MSIYCTKHDKKMSLTQVVDRVGGQWTAMYHCPEGHNVHITSEDWELTIRRPDDSKVEKKA